MDDIAVMAYWAVLFAVTVPAAVALARTELAHRVFERMGFEGEPQWAQEK